jgi:hypothetical protein
MNDELGEVKAKIATTEIKLSKAEAKGKEELVLSLTNLLVRLYDVQGVKSIDDCVIKS